MSESVLDQNGPKWSERPFWSNDLIPNILALSRPKWTILVHFGLKRSILVHLGPPTVLWPFLNRTSWGLKIAIFAGSGENCRRNLKEPRDFGAVRYPGNHVCFVKTCFANWRSISVSASKAPPSSCWIEEGPSVEAHMLACRCGGLCNERFGL